MTIISDRTGVRQALCCECGNLRTVKAGAGRRNHVSTGESPERIAELRDFAPDYWSQIEPYHRLLEDLKCTPCGKVTQHAIVVPVSGPGGAYRAYRDMAEEENLGALAPATEDPGGVLERTARELGIRLIVVADLGRPVVYVRDRKIALVEQQLDDVQRSEAAIWLSETV